jgi:hypothetical protein
MGPRQGHPGCDTVRGRGLTCPTGDRDSPLTLIDNRINASLIGALAVSLVAPQLVAPAVVICRVSGVARSMLSSLYYSILCGGSGL